MEIFEGDSSPSPNLYSEVETVERALSQRFSQYSEQQQTHMGDFEEDVLDPNDEWEDEKYTKPETKAAEDDDDEKGGPSLSPPMISRQFSYDIMSMAEIEEKQVEMTASVAEQFDIPEAEAGILLRFYQWNMNKLIDEWVADAAKVRTKCGISEILDPTSPKISPDSPFTCPLCADDVKYKESDALSCGHRYCGTCWQNWLEAESDKGASAVFTVCIAEGCKECVTDKMMLKYLSPDKKAKYKLWVIEGLVLGNKSMRWCPAPKCDRIVEYKTGGAQEIHCKCGMVFCFKCGQQGHRPVVCDVVATWLLKNSTDSENVNWIIANTKKCPKCGVSIEKNQGCNHMTCGTCRHEFCWLCKGPWSDHGSATGGYYKCNKYEADKGAAAFAEEAKAEEAKNALNKYIHYFTRFDNHDKSIRFAVETRRKAEIVMAKLQDKLGTNYSDVQFVLNAVNAVIECRRVLKWSYVYGYYLEGELEKRIFENHQERLEKFTEALHGLSEKPLEDLLETSMRTQIVNYTRVIEKYRENILAAIESGLKS